MYSCMQILLRVSHILNVQLLLDKYERWAKREWTIETSNKTCLDIDIYMLLLDPELLEPKTIDGSNFEVIIANWHRVKSYKV